MRSVSLTHLRWKVVQCTCSEADIDADEQYGLGRQGTHKIVDRRRAQESAHEARGLRPALHVPVAISNKQSRFRHRTCDLGRLKQPYADICLCGNLTAAEHRGIMRLLSPKDRRKTPVESSGRPSHGCPGSE